jgi:hypothetical protein
MTNEFLEQKFKELLYHFGEINWDILTTKAWNKYINNRESFNQKQFEDLRHFTYDIADEFAIEFAEWLSMFTQEFEDGDLRHWNKDRWERKSTKELLEIYKKENEL